MLFLLCLTVIGCETKTTNNKTPTKKVITWYEVDRTTNESKNKDIEIKYKGFYAPTESNHCNELLFTIYNHTNDTVYISSRDINVYVFKNNSFLKEDKLPSGHPFPPDFLQDVTFFTDKAYPKVFEKRRARNKTIDQLVKIFAEKLYEQNFGNGNMTNDFFYNVRSECLVLFPNDQLNYSSLFISKSLNSDYTVEAEYNKTGVFATYEGDNQKQINIRY